MASDYIPDFSGRIFKYEEDEDREKNRKLQEEFTKKNKVKVYGVSSEKFKLEKRKSI